MSGGDAAKPTEEGKQRLPSESEVSDRLQVLHNLIQQYIHQVSPIANVGLHHLWKLREKVGAENY